MHIPVDAIVVALSSYPDNGGQVLYNVTGMTMLGSYRQYRSKAYANVQIWKTTADTQTFKIGLVATVVHVI